MNPDSALVSRDVAEEEDRRGLRLLRSLVGALKLLPLCWYVARPLIGRTGYWDEHWGRTGFAQRMALATTCIALARKTTAAAYMMVARDSNCRGLLRSIDETL